MTVRDLVWESCASSSAKHQDWPADVMLDEVSETAFEHVDVNDAARVENFPWNVRMMQAGMNH